MNMQGYFLGGGNIASYILNSNNSIERLREMT